MSNAELIVYCGIALTLVIGCLGELQAWLNRQDAKKKHHHSSAAH